MSPKRRFVSGDRKLVGILIAGAGTSIAMGFPARGAPEEARARKGAMRMFQKGHPRLFPPNPSGPEARPPREGGASGSPGSAAARATGWFKPEEFLKLIVMCRNAEILKSLNDGGC
jgi:hypothetical protein